MKRDNKRKPWGYITSSGVIAHDTYHKTKHDLEKNK